jgi:hypothetical protein
MTKSKVYKVCACYTDFPECRGRVFNCYALQKTLNKPQRKAMRCFADMQKYDENIEFLKGLRSRKE